MQRRIWILFMVPFCIARLQAQDFNSLDHNGQVHGSASQGFVHTSDNNWLTMNTADVGHLSIIRLSLAKE
jgi:hypothetical protein